MIEVNYWMKLGNNLFQYCLGRILAIELGYELDAKPIEGFPNTKAKIKGLNYSKHAVHILTGQRVNIQKLKKAKEKRKIVIKKGYFQQYEYYRKYKNQIRKDWLVTESQKKIVKNTEDVIMCVRRGDYLPRHALPFSYFVDALSIVKYRRVYICTDSHDAFITLLKLRYHAKIIPADALSNLELIKSFDKIIISNSTFCWWAAFLSNAKQIIAPIPKRGFWGPNYDINLRVDDEKRYTYIKCKEVYKESHLEKIIHILKMIKQKTKLVSSYVKKFGKHFDSN